MIKAFIEKLRVDLYGPEPEWLPRLDLAAAHLGLPHSRTATDLTQWAKMVEDAIQADLVARGAVPYPEWVRHSNRRAAQADLYDFVQQYWQVPF